MSTWLDAARRFLVQRELDAELLEVLRCFCGPQPRGGPPPPPEDPWPHDFEALERERLADSLDAIADALRDEVDGHQAEIFARRLAAVDAAIATIEHDAARLLRVGLRQRARSIVASPSSRATRIRALADFYYSHVGLLRHRRDDGPAASIEALAAAVTWHSVAPGVEHATLDDDSEQGPVHVNLLRLQPDRVQLRVEDLRPVVERGESFAAHVHQRGAIAAVSGGFFLYSEPDIEAPSRRFDPVGLLVSDGVVLSPPVFRRGALVVDGDGRVSIACLGMQDVELGSPDGRRWRPEVVFNRATGPVGPAEPSAAIVGSLVTAVGSSLPVPLNGFVIPLPWPHALRPGDRVQYLAVHGPTGPVTQGIAGGPTLLCDGEPVLPMREEQFWGTAPPVTFSQDETGDRNLLPRLAAGLRDDGTLVFAAIDGRNFERALGMTLGGVARLLRALGCRTATNLDGGSSKRMVVDGRARDLASTEIVSGDGGADSVRPVHTGVLVLPR